MHPNEQLLEKFFNALQRKDINAVIECLDQEVVYSDPIFKNLQGRTTRAYWHMMLEKLPDLKVEYKNIKANDNSGSACWYCIYNYTKTDRLIRYKIKAKFKFKDGKIFSHTDSYSLWRWAGKALGLTGYFLGFTAFVRNQIRTDAINGLNIYMKRKRIL